MHGNAASILAGQCTAVPKPEYSATKLLFVPRLLVWKPPGKQRGLSQKAAPRLIGLWQGLVPPYTKLLKTVMGSLSARVGFKVLRSQCGEGGGGCNSRCKLKKYWLEIC
ncbi:hypothetical protein Zmor_011936 [Zophobas morio]|uniref:Uncharacterized protein n=1 Tax=Zophobas morio TaxID=2755281 RepID=A0AA38HHX2_9CUCU|nr:hypothetical protein Zmor_011936 [Zophobas morio]